MKIYSSLILIISIIKECVALCSSAETLAKVKNTQKIDVVNGAADHVIPKSTLDSWFTVTNNGGDATCSIQTHYICQNLLIVIGSTCTSFTVDRINGNIVLDPAAQINSNGDWVLATSSYTFTTGSIGLTAKERNARYFIQSELPGGTVKALQVDFNIVTCSSSGTVGIIPSTRDSAITGTRSITEVGDTTGIQFKTYTTGYDLVGAFAGATDPSACPVINVKLYQKLPSGTYTEWTDLSKIRISSSNQLEVNIKDSHFPLTQIYVVGVTSGGKNGILNPHPDLGEGSISFTIEVQCGPVNIQETAGIQSLKYLKQTGQASLTASDFQNYFTLDIGNSPPDCPTLTYKVCFDKSNCDQTLANNINAPTYYDGTSLLTNLSLDQTNNILFIEATTVQGQSAYKQLNITVSCGLETVDFDPLTNLNPQVFSYQMDSTSNSQYQVINTNFLSSFSTSTNYCPITEVRLFQDQGGVISEYSDTSKIRMNNNQLEINIRDNIFAVSDLPKIFIAGVTAAGRNSLQHFTNSLYGIEVQVNVTCGKETITLSQNNVEIIKRLLKTEIEYIELQPYFVVSLNGAHQTCATLTYEAQESGIVLAAPSDFAYVSSGQSTLTLNKAITQSARTIKIKAKTVGNQQVDKSVSFTIQCGTEQIDLKTSTLNSKVTGNKVIVETLDNQAVTQYKTLTSGYDLFGSFNDASDSDLCGVTNIVLYTDNRQGEKTQWTDISKIRLNNKLLEINVRDSAFTEQTLYVVGITDSGRNGLTNTNSIGYFMLQIQVIYPCGQEIISSSISNPNFALQQTKSVTTINVSELFQVDLNGLTNQNCKNLELKACMDINCQKEYQVGDWVHVDQNSLKIDTTLSFFKKVVYIKATTLGSITLTQSISLETCGTETIEVNNTRSQIQVILEQKESNEFYHVPQFIPIQSFTVGGSICNITQVVIYEKNGDRYVKPDLSNGTFKFGDEYNSFLIKRNQELNKTLYITGVTSSGRNGINNPGLKGGIIELLVKISNPQIKVQNITQAEKTEQGSEFERNQLQDAPVNTISIQLEQPGDILFYNFSKIMDIENDQKIVKLVQTDKPWIQININDGMVQFQINKLKIGYRDLGVHNLSFILSDSKSQQQFQYPFQIELLQMQAKSQTQINNVSQNSTNDDFEDEEVELSFESFILDKQFASPRNSDTEELKQYLKRNKQRDEMHAKITEISPLGLVTIEFSEPFEDQFLPIQQQFDDIFKVSLIPYPREQEFFNKTKLEFDWSVNSIIPSDGKIQIQLFFLEPNWISQDSQLDIVKIEILSKFYFIGKRSGNFLSNLVLDKEIQKQILDNIEGRMIVTASNLITIGLEAGLLASAVTVHINDGLLAEILSKIEHLQVLIIPIMFNFHFPSNVQYFQKLLFKVLAFHLMVFMTTINGWLFSFDIEKHAKFKKEKIMLSLQLLEYTGSNFFLNLGFFGQILAGIMLLLIFVIPLSIIGPLKYRKKLEDWKNKFVPGELLAICLSGFFSMYIGIILNFMMILFTYNGEVFSFILLVFWTFMVLIVTPILLVYYIGFSDNHLSHEQYQQRYESLSKDLKTDTRLQRAYHLQFFMKRLILLSVVFCFQDLPQFQLFIYFLICKAFLVYSGCRPFKSQNKNQDFMLNEYFCLGLNVFVVGFTDNVPDLGTQYDIGWIFIIGMLIVILIDNIPIFQLIIRKLRLAILKFLARTLKKNQVQIQFKRRKNVDIPISQIANQKITKRKQSKKTLKNLSLSVIQEEIQNEDEEQETSSLNNKQIKKLTKRISEIEKEVAEIQKEQRISKIKNALKRRQGFHQARNITQAVEILLIVQEFEDKYEINQQ